MKLRVVLATVPAVRHRKLAWRQLIKLPSHERNARRPSAKPAIGPSLLPFVVFLVAAASGPPTSAQTLQLSEGFESPETIFSYSSTHSIPYDVQNSEAAHTGASSLKTSPSTCGASCHDEYRVDLLHTFAQCVRLVGVELWVREDSTSGTAWGGKISVGHGETWNLWWWQAIENGAPITGEWQHVFVPIDDTATNVRIRIMDITSVSTMWLDDVVIHYEHSLPSVDNLVFNSDFSLGNVGFTSDYSYSPGDIWPADTYDVIPDPQISHPWAASYGDHTCGSGLMLAANGSVRSGASVWTQTMSVLPATEYVFTAWVSSWTSGSPAQFQLVVDSVPLAPVFPAPSAAGMWVQISATWDSGTSTAASVSIMNANTAAGGNDFALDDISFSPVRPVDEDDGIRWLSTYTGAAGGAVTVRIWGIGLAADARVLLRGAEGATIEAQVTSEPGGYLAPE